MKNKLLRIVLICVSSILIIAAGIYFSLVLYYRQVFMPGTWINNIYCTGKTLEEVNRELLQNAEAPFLTILDKDGKSYKITAEELGISLDFTEELENLLNPRNPLKWHLYLFIDNTAEIQPQITYDQEKLKNTVSQLAFVREEAENAKELKIILTEDGYVLKDTLRNRLNENAMYTYLTEEFSDEDFLENGMANGEFVVDLKDGSCYEDVIPDETQTETLKQWNDLEEYLNCGIVYDMGDQMIPIAGKIASDFIMVDDKGKICFDQEGQPVIDEESIESFINSLADEYNTYKKNLNFLSTAGEEKTVPYVTYGTEIDVEKETEYLKTAFAEKRSESHIPVYSREGYARGKNDIGDTYIEVDMGNQKLYAYLDGELLVETDIVTGNVKRKMATPEGVVYVYKKQRNRTLRGPGYASFVKYWMPVKGGIGLHDASWRSSFGGEIYKTNGSHGCINIPRDVMDEIYDNFEVGTPVIMFY